MSQAFCVRQVVTFEDSNLLGNVYFTAYFSWQGHCRELFLMKHAPEVVSEMKSGASRLVTTQAACEFFDELLPGDEVEVRLTDRISDERVLRLAFAFARITGADRSNPVVAVGTQDVQLMRPQGSRWVPAPLPNDLRQTVARFRE